MEAAIAGVAAIIAAMAGLIKMVLDAINRREQQHDHAMELRDAAWQAAFDSNTRALNNLVTVTEVLVEEVTNGNS